MIDEPRIFGSDDRPLQVQRYAVVRHPLLPELRLGLLSTQFLEANLHEAAKVRVGPVPPEDPAKQPELIEQQQPDAGKKQALRPEQRLHRLPHSLRSARSIAITGAVAGRMPRQR
ncbi:MAG: hypothetical protein AW07_01003 [Candidatus Accumulibacter sp. SK-11]|nr:MAG: hypothetical protein AW07_01003 [Candidatus Accumulibacter sp. SK-11]